MEEAEQAEEVKDSVKQETTSEPATIQGAVHNQSYLPLGGRRFDGTIERTKNVTGMPYLLLHGTAHQASILALVWKKTSE
jgi:hypothetical protein